MKHISKLAALLLALALVLTLATPALAAQEGTLTGGSITINNAVPGQSYSIYQILYLESYNATDNAYAYKANSAWASWLETQAAYVSIDDQGYVTWVENADAAAFAKLAQAQAASMENDGTATCDEDSNSVSFTGLKLGYYLVDTTLGTLCSLNTTNPNVVMYEKNTPPSIEKQVQEDSDNSWGASNTAQVGDTVNFKTTISAKPGAQNYVMHDVMSDGLTLKADTITVKAGGTTLTAETHYTLTIPTAPATQLGDDCDFEIAFTESYLNSITAATEIVVTYSAILNEEAVISTGANTNKTKLDYGDDSETVWDETKTYSFSFDIVKTKSENDSKFELLDGAEFALYDAQTGGKLIPLVKDGDNYRVATTAESTATGFTSDTIVASNGRATVIGLDANTTYWLEETKQPNGYNKLDGRVEVAITNANISTSLTNASTGWTDGDGGVHIINQTGAELPSTGGMGTTIFYVVGSILLVGAVVLLVVKKRMGSAK